MGLHEDAQEEFIATVNTKNYVQCFCNYCTLVYSNKNLEPPVVVFKVWETAVYVYILILGKARELSRGQEKIRAHQQQLIKD